MTGKAKIVDEMAAFRLAVAIVQRAHNDLKATVPAADKQSARRFITYLQGKIGDSPMFDELYEQAEAVQAEFETSVESVMQDDSLSDSGKRDKIEFWDKQRRQRVSELQAQARQVAESEREQAARKVERLRAEYFDQRRQTLGDSVIADLYRRQVAALDVTDLGRFYDEAAEGFERELVRALIQVELSARGDDSMQAAMLLQQIDDSPAGLRDAELARRELEDVDGIIAKLDVQAYRKQVADTFGVSERSLRNVPLN